MQLTVTPSMHLHAVFVVVSQVQKFTTFVVVFLPFSLLGHNMTVLRYDNGFYIDHRRA
jgi:hypothetical protein